MPITYDLAGVGSRFVAALLDNLIIFGVQAGLFITAAIVSAISGLPSAVTGWVFAIIVLFSFTLLFGYPVLFEIVWNGQTPGKLKTGIRIVRDDGGPITATAAVIRNVVRLADFLPAYYIIGVVVMLIDKKGRRLGDMAAGTICIKERRDASIGGLAPRTPPEEKTAEEALVDALGLSREEAEVAMAYLLLRREMAEVPASPLAARIATHVATRLGVRVDDESAQGFLDRVAEAESPFDVHGLSYDDTYLVKEYLRRRHQMTIGPAHVLATRIANTIAAKLGVQVADESAEEFLAVVAVAIERRGKR
ncbi:MAG: RDD family protein [Chloroflexi bacterium]|nr:RDD family protein [Chloroflexota bacterium]